MCEYDSAKFIACCVPLHSPSQSKSGFHAMGVMGQIFGRTLLNGKAQGSVRFPPVSVPSIPRGATYGTDGLACGFKHLGLRSFKMILE